MEPLKTKWWKVDKKDANGALVAAVDSISQRQNARLERLRDNMKLFLNRVDVPLRPGESFDDTLLYDNVSLNVVHMAGTTLMNKVCMNRPRPMFLTENGSYKQQENARKLQRFVLGVIQQNRVYEECGPMAFQDSLFDTGFLHVANRNGKIVIERVFPGEIIVDESSLMSANPRELCRKTYIPKEVLAQRYPKYKSEIKNAAGVQDWTSQAVTDLVEVYESWHLPSGPDAKDGKRIVCIKEQTLEMEPYTRQSFPFACIRFERKPFGYYGYSLVEQLSAIQKYIDELVHFAQDAVATTALNYVEVDKNSKISKNHIKRFPGIIIEKQGGQGIKIVNAPGINPQHIQLIEFYYNKAFQLARLSQFSVNKDTQGLRTGVALRTLRDADSEGIGLVIRQWEDMFLQVAHMIVEEAREAEERGEDISTKYVDAEFIEKINFKDCKMDEASFTLKIHSTSMLPQTPAGKLALVEELASIGAIADPTQMLDLLEFPDTEKFTSLEAAARRSAEQIAEHILSGDDNYIPPEKFMDLRSAVAICQKHWVRGHLNKVPEERLDNLARWINEAMDIVEAEQQRMQEQQMQMQMAQQQAQQAPPPANPGQVDPAAMAGDVPPEAA